MRSMSRDILQMKRSWWCVCQSAESCSVKAKRKRRSENYEFGKKIYESWAFTENESEKAKINREIYNELEEKYRIYRHDSKIDLVDGVDVNFDDYDIVIGRKACYHHGEYKVFKNTPKLSIDELALICDGGNLCFGYRYEGNNCFYVFED